MQRIARPITLLLSIVLLFTVVAVPSNSASLGIQALKGAAIGFLVTKTAGPLDKFINEITLRHGMQSNLATKVVPILSVGEKGYIGGAQVCGPQSKVDDVKAVFEYEKNFSNNNYRAKVLVPSSSLNPLKLDRVPKVGVTAIIDVSLDGSKKYWTVGSGVQLMDGVRAAAALVVIKNAGPAINSGLNTITFNKGIATKVVPWGSFGEKTYLGAAQVSASGGSIDKVNAVWSYDGLFGNGQFRVKVLLPTNSYNPLKMKRVDGAGISAIVDMALSEQKDVQTNDSRWGRLGDLLNRTRGGNNTPHDNGKHLGWFKKDKQKDRKDD